MPAAYQTPLARRRATRRRILSGLLLSLAALAFSTPKVRPIVSYNASASAPLGLYISLPDQALSRGDWVLLTPPDWARNLAARRGYLPASVPMLKRVVGVTGDVICARNERIYVNGRKVALRLSHDARGRDLPLWQGCRTLTNADVFVLNPSPGSFDGRYFGPIKRTQIRARVAPL